MLAQEKVPVDEFNRSHTGLRALSNEPAAGSLKHPGQPNHELLEFEPGTDPLRTP